MCILSHHPIDENLKWSTLQSCVVTRCLQIEQPFLLLFSSSKDQIYRVFIRYLKKKFSNLLKVEQNPDGDRVEFENSDQESVSFKKLAVNLEILIFQTKIQLYPQYK